MAGEEKEGFKNSSVCCICDKDDIEDDAKVKKFCHITGKNTGSAHINCNINLKLNNFTN